MSFPPLLERLLAGGRLSEEEAQATMDEVLRGEFPPERLAALLVALRGRPVAVDELVGFARSMRQHAVRLHVEGPLLDTCGTGGAVVKTFNISTAAAFVAAAAGARVAKHGNRSVTRPSGSADVLERAGARLDLSAEAHAQVLGEVGITFLFAPSFHPAMRHAAPVRKALGVTTVFNLLGPLCNPAGAQHQLLGVHDPDLVVPMAQALHRLGCQKGIVVHGLPGTDEATPCGRVLLADAEAEPDVQEFTCTDFGMPACEPAVIAPVAAEAAPDLVEDLLAGHESGPREDAVVMNAGLGLLAAGIAKDPRDGMEASRAAIQDGSGTAKWRAFIEATQRHG